MSNALVVDDHPVIRLAVRMLLERAGHKVLGEADNGLDALQLAREQLPDLMVLDIGIPKLGGLEVIRRLQAQSAGVRILVFTSVPASQFAVRCMSAGAWGFVAKAGDLRELEHAITTVMSGYRHFPYEAVNSVQNSAFVTSEQALIGTLSNRELSVLKLLAIGKTNMEIADDLLLSNKTISTYKARLQEKLNLHTLVDLIEFAKRNDLIGPE